MSIWRMNSFIMLTDCSVGGQSGSTVAQGSRPSWVRQKIHEPVPPGVVGHVVQQPPDPVGQHVVVVLGGDQPRRRALEHQQLAGLVGDRRG